MKLARPDVFHPRIVLAGSPALPEGDRDDAGLIPALRKRGLHARWLSWDDPATLKADLVILRAARDCGERLAEFLDWTRRVRNLLNAPEVVAWNTDERHLADLADAGVPTMPRAHGRASPETALVFLGGRQSHALARGGEVEPDFEVWDVGHAALAAAADQLKLAPTDLLYARVDVVGERTDPRLRRLDLVAPALGWQQLQATTRARQQRVFVLEVESALDRLGLGPFSHRRP
ncbi:hypothetical protein H7I53_19495 [Mycolicibacterium pulveris]|uniref:Uncharacterized protein n=1 Tax=Mycolicibacterium pulveris TaxID=36813 RepID=A0A7I7URF6_MYCPV|nr:hypothetical protein [Mycolicibacterium pulveris]MCV6982398.1 hypothetical protein [Mycolicibacterium pulveris]BBY83947.1 hypothetical protein MPUL_51050 [Mycolicibacterium pulveris]